MMERSDRIHDTDPDEPRFLVVFVGLMLAGFLGTMAWIGILVGIRRLIRG